MAKKTKAAQPVCAVKLPLEMDTKTQAILDGQARICNKLYNILVEKANTLRDEYIQTQSPEIVKTLYTERGLRDLLTGLKEAFPFLKTVHSSPLKNAALRLSKVIQDYQKSRKGKRKGKETGWPHFRSCKVWFSLLYDEPNKGFKVNHNQLKLSLGADKDKKRLYAKVTLQESYRLKGKVIRNLRVCKEANTYFAVFTVDHKLPVLDKPIRNMITLDPNHSNLAYGVDSDLKALEIDAPTQWLKKLDKAIDEVKSKRDRCVKKVQHEEKKADSEEVIRYHKASNRWTKLDNVFQELMQKRREQTKTYLYTIANKLYNQYDYVAIGNYAPRGNGITVKMRRSMNNNSLIGRFKEVLEWVAQKRGKRFTIFNEKGTTRTCHCCLTQAEGGLSPSMREWQCTSCGTDHIRDENAAINGARIVQAAINQDIEKQFSIVPSSGRVRIKGRSGWCALPRGIHSMNRGKRWRSRKTKASVSKLNETTSIVVHPV